MLSVTETLLSISTEKRGSNSTIFSKSTEGIPLANFLELPRRER